MTEHIVLQDTRGDESEVVIPTDRVFTILSDKIFRGHSEITSIQIPDTVTDIGEFVFDGCVNLRHLKLPANLRTLWGYSFVRCGIEEIVLPDQLRIIPPFAFKECKTCGVSYAAQGLRRSIPGHLADVNCLRKRICFMARGWRSARRLSNLNEVRIWK